MARDRVLAMILAGGRGERLHPLTRDRTKPAVPFGGRYRIVDFVLSNFVNSGILSLYVLVQYKAQSLIEHLRVAWRAGGLVPEHFITVVWRAHMDLLGEEPRFDLDNRHWPILTGPYQGPPARIVGGEFENAEIGAGSLVKRATVRNSILGRGVWVNEGAVVEDSILMDFTAVGKGAHLRRVIVDRFNIVGAGQEIGLDPAADRQRYHVDATGLVVIPRGGRREFLWSMEEP